MTNECKCCDSMNYLQMIVSIKANNVFKIEKPENMTYNITIFKGFINTRELQKTIDDLTKIPSLSFDINNTINDYDDSYTDILGSVLNSKNLVYNYYYLGKNIHKIYTNYVNKIINQLANPLTVPLCA